MSTDDLTFGADQYNFKPVEKFVDTATGSIVEPALADPWEQIKTVAAASKIDIKPPRKGCHKCYGRGWIGRDSKTQQPIACNCIFDKKIVDSQPNRMWNRSVKRGMELETRRRMKKKGATILKQTANDLMTQNLLVQTSSTEEVKENV